jgi:hypothetical protein
MIENIDDKGVYVYMDDEHDIKNGHYGNIVYIQKETLLRGEYRLIKAEYVEK